MRAKSAGQHAARLAYHVRSLGLRASAHARSGWVALAGRLFLYFFIFFVCALFRLKISLNKLYIFFKKD
jgi:hypothetical protein